MLVRNRTARLLVHTVAIALLLAMFALPFLVIILGAFATSWAGVLPSGATLGNFTAVFTESATAHTVTASLLTAFVATALALVIATTAALSARRRLWLKRILDTVFLLPVAIPSVAVGLALLMAFSSGPLRLNGTVWIVVVAHTVLVVALAYQPISAAVLRLDPAFEEAASALGASRTRILTTVVLPLLRPALAGAAAMCIAMSMGELTAMMMVAPPSWRTMPLQIFSFTSRGIRLYESAALAVLLLLITLLALLVLQRTASRRTGITASR